jgi:hypothetical protein
MKAYLGIDVSKGYADFTLLNEQKKELETVFQLDDPHWRKSSDLCHTIIQAAPSQQVLYYHNNPLHCCKHIIRDYKPILSAQDFHVCNLISVPAFLHHLIQ